MTTETPTIWQKIVGAIVSAVKAIEKWRNQNWEDLLGLAGLVMIWHGVAIFSVGAAWIIIGALLFAVASTSVLLAVRYRFRAKGDGQ